MDLFEVKLQHEKVDDNSGKQKKVTEVYLVEAFTYSDAETVGNHIIEDYHLRNAKITGIKQAKYNEIFSNASEELDENFHWYKCKVEIDNGEGAKPSKNLMLVLADSVSSAVFNLSTWMKGTMADWENISAEKTNIVEVVRKN